jgi:hypothetical protein
MQARSLLRFSISLLGSIVSIAGCSTPKTAQPSSQPQAQKSSSVTASSDDWSPTQIESVQRYLVKDSATISIKDDSSRTSSIQTRISYLLTYSTKADSFLLATKVESLTTNSHDFGVSSSRVRTDTNMTQLSHTTISINGHIGTITQQLPSQCPGGIDPFAARIFELTISYPKNRIRVGDEWTDTISTTTCRGKTAVFQQSERHYKLLELSSSAPASAKIQRDVRTTFTGTAGESSSHPTATGSGTSSATIYTDLITGSISRSVTHAQSTLTITTPRGTYPFTQNVITEIERR